MKYLVGGVFAVLVLVAGLWSIGAWSSDSDRLVGGGAVAVRDDGEFTITTSFYPLQFVLERIVGNLAVVTNIGAGRDPHDFRPSTQDMVMLKRADVVVLQGADFEPWGDAVAATLVSDGVPVIIATADIELHEGGHDHGEDESHTDEHTDEHDHTDDAHAEIGHGEEHHEAEHEGGSDDEHEDHDHGAYDPHTWLDPVLLAETVEHIASKIAVLDPINAETYMTNAAALQTDLLSLDSRYAASLANCKLNEVITAHDAFGYLGDRYNFEIHSIAGLSTQDTPSAITLATLKVEAAEGISAILLEENSISAYGETLARETGLQTLSINPIAYIIPVGGDYFSLMEENLNTFATALNCNE